MSEKDIFMTHGVYTVSNCIGYEIQLSKCGDAARYRCQNSDETYFTSDWLEIEWINDPECKCGDVDEHKCYSGGSVAIIEPKGINIPLNMVMRVNH